MNTHKEEQAPIEWLLDDLLITILDSSPKELVGLHNKLEALAESIQERKSELTPLEPKEECGTSCGINADPADGFGKCTCGAEAVRPTPPSQIEEETIYRLIMLWHDYNKHSYTGGTVRSEVTFEEFIQSSWLLEAINKLTKE